MVYARNAENVLIRKKSIEEYLKGRNGETSTLHMSMTFMTKQQRIKQELANMERVCANPNCGKSFVCTELELLSNAILNRLPACSYECNKALGQVKQ